MRLLRRPSALAIALVIVGGSLPAASAHVPVRPPPPRHRRHRPKPPEPPAASPAPPSRPPPVVAENELQGAPDWLGPDASGTAAEVYASATDAAPGDDVGVHVSTAPAMPYRILVYRLGLFAGAGARAGPCSPGCGRPGKGRRPAPPAG